jgi:hypothetical protein
MKLERKVPKEIHSQRKSKLNPLPVAKTIRLSVEVTSGAGKTDNRNFNEFACKKEVYS